VGVRVDDQSQTPTGETPHAKLVRLLSERSFRTGDFVLASGARSSFYIDARLTTMSPDGMRVIAHLALEAMHTAKWQAEAVGGLTLGADPVAYAIAYASGETERPLRAFTVRKEPKGHGTGRQVEGPFVAGDRCVIVEDTLTTGASALRAIDAVRREGGSVVGVLGVVDREEGARDAIAAHGLSLLTLTRVSELAAYVKR
jgi:orotate phosphoribosyltransferase